MGSKRLMLENGLGELLESQAKHSSRIFDPFCGSGAVAWFAAQRTGRKIIASDLQEYAAVIAGAVIRRTSALIPEDIAADWFKRSRELLASWPAFDFALQHSKTNPLSDAIHYVHSARELCESNGSVVSTNMSNTQHKARYVISVDLGRAFLSPTAMYTGKRPDGPWAPRPELFKMFVDST